MPAIVASRQSKLWPPCENLTNTALTVCSNLPQWSRVTLSTVSVCLSVRLSIAIHSLHYASAAVTSSCVPSSISRSACSPLHILLMRTYRLIQNTIARVVTGIGVARILSFLVVALKDRLNIPPNLTRPAKTVLKIDSCSGWGVHFVSWGCTYTFSLWLRLKNFFHRPGGGAGAPTEPPGYAYGYRYLPASPHKAILQQLHWLPIQSRIDYHPVIDYNWLQLITVSHWLQYSHHNLQDTQDWHPCLSRWPVTAQYLTHKIHNSSSAAS